MIVQVPEWISRVVAELKAKYSRDDFACVPKPRPEGGPPDWRMKCLDWYVVLRSSGSRLDTRFFSVRALLLLLDSDFATFTSCDLASPRITSCHLVLPRITSCHVVSPRFTSYHLVSANGLADPTLAQERSTPSDRARHSRTSRYI
jgi:hypothetical protein